MLQEAVEQVAEQPIEQVAEQPVAQTVPKKKTGLLIGIVAAVVVIVAAVVGWLLLSGPSVNKLLAGRMYELYIDGDSWTCLTVTFDEMGENYTYDIYTYLVDENDAADYNHYTRTGTCEFEKEENMYKTSDFAITVEDGAITSMLSIVDGEVVEYVGGSRAEFCEVGVSQINDYLENQALEIFSNYRVYSYSSKTYAQVIPLVVDNYRLECTAVNETQYRITVTGSYCPNKADMPNYVQDGGKYVCLVDIETKEGRVEQDVGIGEAMRLYVVLTTW